MSFFSYLGGSNITLPTQIAMKKFAIYLFALLLIQQAASSQSCLPEGIVFTTQSQIDNFQGNYPGCTEIEGDVTIDSLGITNLNGLSVLTSIGGNLTIWITSVTNLTGLNALTSVNGKMLLYDNFLLSTLEGLENLTTIGGTLEIHYNEALTSIAALNNLTSVGDTLYIYYNGSLVNLTGLNNLNFIPGDLFISDNDALISLAGLDNVDSIGGNIVIHSNEVLSNISSLGNLTSINGYLMIWNNAALPYLSGLNNVTSIAGGLTIVKNEGMISLTGLENLTHIGGSLGIGLTQFGGNASLTSLSGLSSLNSIGGGLYISRNSALASLEALNNLDSIGGDLEIYDNSVLTTLSGLDNIVARSIDNLSITYNNFLSTCEVQSVCDYLASPNGTIEIHDNATGCNSQEEVEAVCGVGLAENFTPDYCSLYPNPFTGETTFSIHLQDQAKVNLTVFNNLGQVVTTILDESLTNGSHQVTWNAEGLPAGIYFYKLTATGHRPPATGKMVVAELSQQ